MAVHPTDLGEIRLAEHSWFFAGGQYVETDEGGFLEGSMYVENYVPAARTQDVPVVMVHGKGQTGIGFTGTPDGRRGWLHDFLRAGYQVYVVDQPERGRSGHGMSTLRQPDALTRSPAERVERIFTPGRAVSDRPRSRHHDQWPGTGVRGDADFDQFYSSQVESLSDGRRTQELNRAALVALLDRIGRAVLLTHSQSGSFGWAVADARPDLVAAILAVEPHGPPFHTVMFEPAGGAWYRYAEGRSLPWGISALPLTYEPPASTADDLQPVLDEESGDEESVMAYRLGRPRRLPNLAGIPILIVSGQASYHACYDYATSLFLTDAGVENDYVALQDVGITGNGHMMMQEKNNHQIADWLLGWLDGRASG